MEVVAAVGVIAAAPIIYRTFRHKTKTTVECWFCHEKTKVEYEKWNSFVCPSCEQYNGFTEDGGYNKRIPGQTYTEPKRYCVPAKKTEKTSGFLNRFNGVNMSPKSSNGLCSECNLGQELIMKKIAEFEPIDEERWADELEDYRYKLERANQLCPRCTIQVHGKLEEDKKKYSYLFELKYKLKNAIGTTLQEVINPNRRKSRRSFFAGGWVCEALHFGSLLSTILLFIATIDFLQQDAGTTLINFNQMLRDHLPIIYSSSFFINSTVLVAHLLASFNNKCRVTLPDLLLPIIILIFLLTFLISDINHSQDVALIRCACASFSAVLSMAVTLLPRKRLHKRKPNKIISSAFSVASTPTSQCSSQNSRNASLLDQNTSNIRSRRSPYQHSPSTSPQTVRTSPGLLRDVTNAPMWSRNVRENKENDGEAMDWDDSESVARSSVTTRSQFQPGLLARSRGAVTPHQLAPSVANMSFLGTARAFDSPSAPSVFSRQHRQILQQQNVTPARSLFGPPRSMVASNVDRTNYMAETNTRSGSVFTSVSQQDGHSTVSGAWQCRVLAILFALVFIVLIMQIALFYVLFTRK